MISIFILIKFPLKCSYCLENLKFILMLNNQFKKWIHFAEQLILKGICGHASTTIPQCSKVSHRSRVIFVVTLVLPLAFGCCCCCWPVSPSPGCPLLISPPLSKNPLRIPMVMMLQFCFGFSCCFALFLAVLFCTASSSQLGLSFVYFPNTSIGIPHKKRKLQNVSSFEF